MCTMFAQGTDDVYRIAYGPRATYGDLHLANERESSDYNFNHADVALHQELFTRYEQDAKRLLAASLLMPAYEQLLKCSHTFNLLDARGAISQADRPRFILRIRTLAKRCAELYLERQAQTSPTRQSQSPGRADSRPQTAHSTKQKAHN